MTSGQTSMTITGDLQNKRYNNKKFRENTGRDTPGQRVLSVGK